MIIKGNKLKEKLLQGINLVADTVKPTLGPQARTVILQGNPPVVINDGVTITKYITHEDPYVQMGIQLVQNLAAKAQDNSGDGTTTACVLAQALCNSIYNATITSHLEAKKQLEQLQEEVLKFLDDLAEEVQDKDIINVATIAANNDSRLGSFIAEAFEKVGRDGIITVEESRTHNTSLEVKEGLQFDEGFLTHLMSNNEDGKTYFDSPLIFSSNMIFNNFQPLLPMLEYANSKSKPLIIICRGMEGPALNNIIANVINKTIQVAVVTAPNFGDAQIDELGDIVSSVGGKLFLSENKENIGEISVEDFGHCEKAIITKDDTTFIGSTGDTSNKISALKETIKDAKDKYLKMRAKKRLARLTGGIATIRVGAGSQIEMRETKERLDDALNATKAALHGGVIVGGGMALLNANAHIHENVPTCAYWSSSLLTPIGVLFNNSEINLLQLDNCKGEVGLNAKTNEFVNLKEAGVIDPVIVVKNSFNAAVSIAKLFLSTDSAVLLEE
tara:strand:- start:2107 stop:3612 length:1506 start_codon:yes stop_codon:yes gene_type:complete